MNSPLVSVILPNYNHAKYLDERIQSILNQTYCNFELIILDDCSPDNGASKAVIEKYRENSHVSHIVYNEKNSGLTFKQWHKGIGLAQGNLIWIAESDDKCHHQMLEVLVEEFKKNSECALAFSKSLLFNDNDIIEDKDIISTHILHLSGSDFIKKYMSLGNVVQNASSALFRKDVVQKIDQSYVSYKGAGDRLFWILISEYGDVAIVTEQMNYFRQHQDNSTKKYYYSGVNQREDKNIIDYIYVKKYISTLEYKLKSIQYVYLWIYKEKIKDNNLKGTLFDLWLPSFFDKMLFAFYQFSLLFRKKMRIL